MKKSMIALAVLGALTGAAQAQSSVTLFGIVDAAIARVSGDTYSKTGITNSGLNSSRLGFRGSEDLGGGLKANFWLESSLNNDDSTGFSFNNARRSYVGLSGGFGEVKLGREYSPSFWNLTIFDAFGTNGIGSNNAIGMLGATNGFVRSNNSISYQTPGGLGGFFAQLQYAFGETASNAANNKTGNYAGIRAGYDNGPLSVAVATGKSNTGLATATTATDITYTNLGAAYDFGVVKPMLLWATEKDNTGASKVTALELSATAPLGSGELRAAYSKYDVANSSNDWKKFAIGYGYNLSKRSQLYATYAKVNNSGLAAAVVSNGLAPATVGGSGSSGLELGLRHSF